MHFTRVAGQNFRLFPAFSLEPRPGVNLLLGANAAGKTTLLEAIYALGRARSFRGAPPEQAGSAGAHWRVQGRLVSPAGPPLAVGLKWDREGVDLRLDQSPASVQDLVSRVAVQAPVGAGSSSLLGRRAAEALAAAQRVDRLQQRGLAGGVGAEQQVEPGAGLEAEGGEEPEVLAGDAGDVHSSLVATLLGMTPMDKRPTAASASRRTCCWHSPTPAAGRWHPDP